MKNDKIEQLRLKYKHQIDLRIETEKKLQQVKNEKEKMLETKKLFKSVKFNLIKKNREKLREAIKSRDLKKIVKYSKNMANIEKTIKGFEALSYSSSKIKKSFENFIKNNSPLKNKEIDLNSLKNYKTYINANGRYYTFPNSKLRVLEQKDYLTVRGGKSIEEKAKALVQIAKSKKWDLEKLDLRGNPKFVAAVKKEIDLELKNTKINTFKKLEQMKKLETPKQLEQKKANEYYYKR